MIEIRSLANISFDRLYNAFADAFSNYDAPPMTKEALGIMLDRRGFTPEYSFGAFDKDKLVSFTFNGIGLYDNLKTAYDTGTGTIAEYRGQKLASKIFEESIPHLQKLGIEQYLLEVLQHNTPAVNIYRAQGFEVSREFLYYFINTNELKTKQKSLSGEYLIQEIDLSQKTEMESFWDFEPAWQNNFDSIERRKADFVILGALLDKQLVGYGIIDPLSGDITQLSIDKMHRRKGIATNLFYAMAERNTHTLLKVVNTELSYKPMSAFMENLTIPIAGKQYEMKLKI